MIEPVDLVRFDRDGALGKPAPDPVRHAARTMGVDPARCATRAAAERPAGPGADGLGDKGGRRGSVAGHQG
ncbi:hypothetical protein [Streptomyces sp. NRRL S-350]|uniref:hypothetical protein n=1 Tax=Streptomyces sp. NRRL S-350 TaxID=1463902 RepID=UPI0004BE682E|nr:hypothetical protein [Streptomyces sp. NRRL S-350]